MSASDSVLSCRGLRKSYGDVTALGGLDLEVPRNSIRRRVCYLPQQPVFHDDLLILAEPASALEPLGRRDVLEIVRRLKETTTVFFSIHIRHDVQRVSDTVAILKGGVRVAQAPIEQLLAGSGGAAFTVPLRGDGRAALQLLRVVLADERVEVLAFGRVQSGLEEIFVELVEDTA